MNILLKVYNTLVRQSKIKQEEKEYFKFNENKIKYLKYYSNFFLIQLGNGYCSKRINYYKFIILNFSYLIMMIGSSNKKT